jgi:uncharacterized protein YndB with AHSA1/START domain
MKPAEASLSSDTEVLVKRSFDAPVNLVWRAYMEPDLMRRWCSGPPGWSMPVCEMDMRVGGKYRWQWRSDENGQAIGCNGEVLEITPHAKVVHTQRWDSESVGDSMGSEPSIITVAFKETNGITHVTTTIKFASKADRDVAFATGMTGGMEMSYKQLDGMLEKM